MLLSLRSRTTLLWGALVALLVTSSCGLTESLDTLISEPLTTKSAAVHPTNMVTSGSPIAVFFTDPDAPTAADWTGGPDEKLIASIDAAQTSVDMAIYSISLDRIGDALLRARERGVTVRLVLEQDNLERRLPVQLLEQGLPIEGDRGQGRMHNKFVIIDGREVWTGSMNFTGSGAYDDNNNLVQIQSDRVAKDYTAEFEEMFNDHQFGEGSPANTPYPTVELGDLSLEILFSPDDGVEAHLIKLIRNAKTSVTVLAFSFTSDDLSEALLERANAGIKVRIVLDEEQASSNTGGEYLKLKNGGIDVRLDGIPGQMHHKVLIVDEEWVAFGSYNFTRSAEIRNDENLILAHDPALARQFLEEFNKIYAQARP